MGFRALHLILSASLILDVAGCSTKVPADNPYDPNAPVGVQHPGVVSGTVVLVGAASSAGVEVILVGERTFATVSGEDGAFSIGGVVAGLYRLIVRPTGYRAVERTGIEVKVAGEIDLGRVVLEPARGTIAGRIGAGDVDDNVTLAGAIITARRFRPDQSSPARDGDVVVEQAIGVATSSDGSFTFDSVRVGTYSISVQRDDLSEVCVPDIVLAEDGEYLELPVIAVVRASALLRVVDADGATLRHTADSNITVEVVSFAAAALRHAQSEEALATQAFEPMSVSFEEDLAGADGEAQVYVQFLDACQNESRVYEASVILDRAPPDNGVVVIGEGAPYITALEGNVALSLSAHDEHAGVGSMRIAFDGSDPALAAPRDYVPDLVAPLGSADGTKQVRVIFIDRAGNESDEVTASVIKDSRPPELLSAIDLQATGLEAVLTFDFAVGDEPVAMAISNYSGTAGGPWILYTSPVTWSLLSGPDGPRTVYCRFMDAAGNMTDEITTTLPMVDLTPPRSPILLIAGDAGWTNQTTSVPLSLSVEDDQPGTKVLLSGCSDFCAGIGCDPCCHTYTDWAPYDPATATTWDFTGCEDGLVVVYARFRDASGKESAVTHDSIRLDTVGPEIMSFGLVPAAAAVSTVSVNVALSATDPGNADAALSVALVNDPTPEDGCAEADFAGADFMPLGPVTTFLLAASDGTKAICARVKDSAGNTSAVTATACTTSDTSPDCLAVLLDTVAPDPPRLLEGDAMTSAETFTLHVTSTLFDPAPSSSGLHHEVRGGQYIDWTDAAGAAFTFTLRHDAQNRLGVRAVDAVGNASTAAEVVVVHDATAPLPPYVIDAVGISGITTVRWAASPAPDIDYYLLYYGNFPGSYNGAFALEGRSPIYVPAQETSARITGASDLSTVYFAVAAVDQGGLEGPLSNEVSAFVLDTASRVVGFVGGPVRGVASSPDSVFMRTPLGVERMSMTPSPRALQGHFAPIADDDAASGPITYADGYLYLLEPAGLVRLAVSATEIMPVAFVPFDDAGAFESFVIATEGERTLAYLGGNARLAVYDVTPGEGSELIYDIDTLPLSPDKLVRQSYDFGAGVRQLLYAFEASTIHVFDVSEPAAPEYLAAQPVYSAPVGAIGNRVIYPAGWWGMQAHIDAATFDGQSFTTTTDYYVVSTNDPTGGVEMFPEVGLASGTTAALVFRYSAWLFDEMRYAYMLEAVSLADPAAPALISASEIPELAGVSGSHAAALAGGLAFVGGAGVRFIDTMDAGGMVDAGGLTRFSGKAPAAVDVADGVVLYGAAQNNTGENTIVRVDMSAPARPVLVAAIAQDQEITAAHHTPAYDLVLAGSTIAGTLYLLDFATGTKVQLTNSPLYELEASSGLIFGAGASYYSYPLGVYVQGVPQAIELGGGTAQAPQASAVLSCTMEGNFDEDSYVFAVHKSKTSGRLYALSTRAYDQVGYSLQACEYPAAKADPSDPDTCACSELLVFEEPMHQADFVYNEDGYIYISMGDQVTAFDISTGVAVRLGSVLLPGPVRKISEVANYLAAVTDAGTYLIDVAAPGRMKYAGQLPGGLACLDIATEGSRIYCATCGIVAYELVNAATPRWAGELFNTDYRVDFAVRGHAAVSLDADSVKAYHITDLNAPTLVGTTGEMPITAHCLGSSFEVYSPAGEEELYVSGGRLGLCTLTDFPELDVVDESDPAVVQSAQDSLVNGDVLHTAVGRYLDRYTLPFGATVPAPGVRVDAETLDISALPYSGLLDVYDGRFLTNALDPGRGLLFAAGMHEARHIDTSYTSMGAIMAFDATSLAPVGILDYGLSAGGYYTSDNYPADLSVGSCGVSAPQPCVAIRDFIKGYITLIDAANPAAMVKRYVLKSETYYGGDPDIDSSGGRGDVAVTTVAGQSLVLVTSPDAWAFSVWRVSDAWAMTKLARLSGGYEGMYLDESGATPWVVLGAKGRLEFVDLSTPSSPVVQHHIHYEGLEAPDNIRRAGNWLYFTVGKQLRRVDVSAGYASATDGGGYSELTTPRKLTADSWIYYVLDSGWCEERPGQPCPTGLASSIQALEANEPASTDALFKGLSHHQYTPRSGIRDLVTRPGRIYLCRALNEDEGDGTHGFEILHIGLPSARPTAIGTAAVACDHLAVAGDLAWAVDEGDATSEITVTTIDLTDETAPSVAAPGSALTFASTERVVEVTAVGRYLFAAVGNTGVRVFALDAAGVVEPVSLIPTIAGKGVSGIVVAGDRLYVSQAPGYLAVYDIRDPAAPSPLASLFGVYGSVDVSGVLGFVTPTQGGTRVVDLR